MRSSLFAIIAILFSISTISRPTFAIRNPAEPDSAQLIIKAPLSEYKEALITVTELAETTPEQIHELLRSSQNQNSDVIISTDQESVVKAVAEATAQPGDKRLVRFIPIGKLANASQKISAGFNAYYGRAKNTIMHDRIGLTVLTVTVGYDTLLWIHSASFDIHQKTSMVLMNLVLAATLGLDKDLWTKMTSPLKNRLINVFDRFLVNDKFASIKVFSGLFLSNMIFSVAIQSARIGLLSLDHISDVVTTSAFWLNSIKIGGLITMTAFAWTEMYGSIQVDKNPVAKMVMKRVSDMRGIILSQLASISMVLQPHVYGHVPITTFIIHGSLGLVALANTDRIINFLESNTLVNRVYRKVQTFENFINEGLQFKTRGNAVVSCQSLFAT